MNSEPDTRLRRLLRLAHEADAAAPDFDRLLVRPRPAARRRLPRWAALAAVAALLVLSLTPLTSAWRERRALAFAREFSAWRAPTDRLIPRASDAPDPLHGLGGPSVLGDTHDLVRWR